MSTQHHNDLRALIEAGWKVDGAGTRPPPTLLTRYRWLPSAVIAFLESFDSAVAPDETLWLLSGWDYSGESESAFAWNEFESLSLRSADDDPEWREEIVAFWDDHFPLALSVRSGFEHFSLQRDGRTVVHGSGPEFEETEPFAEGLDEFLEFLGSF